MYFLSILKFDQLNYSERTFTSPTRTIKKYIVTHTHLLIIYIILLQTTHYNNNQYIITNTYI